MTWTAAARHALLGTDANLLDQYCAAVTRARLGAVPPAAARCVIWRLTEILPLAAHSTPGLWTPDKEPQPFVAIGRLSRSLSILGPKVALFAVDAHLHLAAEEGDVREFSRQVGLNGFAARWQDFRSLNNRRLFLFPEPLDCQSGVELRPGHPLAEDHRLLAFLRWMATRHAQERWMVSPETPATQEPEAPGGGRIDGVELGCIYPGLLERLRSAPDDDGPGDEGPIPGPDGGSGVEGGPPIRTQAPMAPVEPLAGGRGATADAAPGPRATCDIAVITVDARDVLDAIGGHTGRCGVPFLDTAYTPRAHTSASLHFQGPGIYALLFTPADEPVERVVYVGSYCTAFAGNVVDLRWRKHLGACTARGHRVSVGPVVQQQLAARLPVQGLPHPLAALTANVCLRTDAGCQAGLNRLGFALANWPMFDPVGVPDLLAPFRWAYVRLRSAPAGLDPATLRACIKAAEDDLIDVFRPECNSHHVVPPGNARDDVTAEEFIHETMDRLCSFWPRRASAG
jgi:hypothetical protein